MKVGLIGLPQTGKKTLFKLLTGEGGDEGSFGAKTGVKMGVAKIRDNRFDKLVEMYSPKKNVPATIDIVLLPKFDKETVQSGEFLKSLETCDALCHIVREFKEDSVFHVDGTVNSSRDMDNIFSELILSDLILIEKRVEKMTKELMNKSTPMQVREKDILLRMKGILDENLPLSTLDLSNDEKKITSTYQFLTRKPLIIVLNVNDNKLDDRTLVETTEEKYKKYNVKVMQISAKIEAELSLLDPEEREAFLKDLNISESALNKLSRLCYKALGLVSFFTVSSNEVHAWTTKRNSMACESAGVIHSDMQRGFIRAEIMKSHELFEYGSESKLKDAGKMLLKGKDYILEDGDIMFVRFNV